LGGSMVGPSPRKQEKERMNKISKSVSSVLLAGAVVIGASAGAAHAVSPVSFGPWVGPANAALSASKVSGGVNRIVNFNAVVNGLGAGVDVTSVSGLPQFRSEILAACTDGTNLGRGVDGTNATNGDNILWCNWWAGSVGYALQGGMGVKPF
jgi:hypothetical protein